MNDLTNFLINLFIIIPITTIIHEIGHTVAVLFFGARLTLMTFGKGKRLLKIGIVEIRLLYFIGGSFHYKNLTNYRVYKKVLIMLSGPLLNLITGMMFFCLILLRGSNTVLNNLVFFSFVSFIVNLIPFSYSGTNTDGKQILDLLKSGKSSYYKEQIERQSET